MDGGSWIIERGNRCVIFNLRSSIYYPRSSIYDLRSSISHLRPVGQDGLAEAGGNGVHPPVGQAFRRAEGEDNGENDGERAGHGGGLKRDLRKLKRDILDANYGAHETGIGDKGQETEERALRWYQWASFTNPASRMTNGSW